ncbi:hypothetical protein OAG67_00780 [bacterium]|nr:hypothetical protein [bacterium]
MKNIKKVFLDLRRKILKFTIPEFFWPKYVSIDDVKFKLRNTPYSFGVKWEIFKGGYEVAERFLLKDQIIEGDTIIEMGGSIGVVTALLQNMTGKKGFVVSIEASLVLSDYSRSWLESDNTKIIHGYGFPVNKLEKSINVLEFDEPGASLGGNVIYEIPNEKNENENEKIPEGVYDINKVCNQYDIVPTVLMIDIEGSEKILLSQKPKFPNSIRIIIIELHLQFYSIEDLNLIVQYIIDDGFVIVKQVDQSYLFSRR